MLSAASKFTLTVPQGASTQVFLAAGADGTLTKGAFYEDLKVKTLPASANDATKAKQLWDVSENLGGVEFKLKTTSTATVASSDKPSDTSASPSKDENTTSS